jgi:ankyrin repeat protein
LLDLGTSPDVRSHTNFRPLHAAAQHDSVRVGKLLIERGAAVDPLETYFNGTPLTWAIFYERPRMIELLGPLSTSPKSLARLGNVERLGALLAADPKLARTIDANGSLLAYLPADEDRALETAELLLAHGADPLVKGKEGNAIEIAERRGLEAVAKLLRSRDAGG